MKFCGPMEYIGIAVEYLCFDGIYMPYIYTNYIYTDYKPFFPEYEFPDLSKHNSRITLTLGDCSNIR